MKRLLTGTSIALVLLFNSNALWGQEPCLTDQLSQRLAQEDPNYAYHLQHDHDAAVQAVQNNAVVTHGRSTRTIPIVFHVVYNNANENVPNSAIYAQLETLNKDFRRQNSDTTYPRSMFAYLGADVDIEFCLAKRGPGNQSTVGITRTYTNHADWNADTESNDMKSNSSGGINAWDPTKYLNVWIVDLATTGSGAQTAGYAYLGNSGVHGAWYDGVVLDYAIGFGGSDRSLTHEVGHYLGLKHTWGNSQSCNSDDGINDTPRSDGPKFGCDLNSASCGSTDMIENYMDYADCKNMFTAEQASYMNYVLTNYRSSLLSSDGCTAPPKPGFYTQFTNVCTGSTIQFIDTSINDPSNWQWTFAGGTPSTSSSQNPLITYTTPGTYQVQLIAGNAYGANAELKSGYITVGTGGTTVVFDDDFESGVNGWQTINTDNAITWQLSNTNGNGGSKAMGIDLFSYATTGTRDQFITPAMDFSGITQSEMSFEYAYRPYATNNNDSLIIRASNNGGNSFPYVVWAAGGQSLATSDPLTTGFIPDDASDWCGATSSCATVDLSQFDGQNNIKLMFEAYNDYGNNIYFDDVLVYGGCTNAVVVNNPPLAAFAQDKQVGCGQTTVQFTDQSSFVPTSWQWSFPGGIPPQSTDQNPTVTYYTNGTYDVILTAVNANGQNSVTTTGAVVINDKLTVSIDSTSTACYGSANGSARLSVSGGVPGYTYSWSNGASGRSQTGLAGGTYSVTIADAGGCESIEQVVVDSIAPMQLQFSTRADRTGGLGTPNGEASVIVVTGTGAEPYTYAWDDPQGQTTATASNLGAGTYTVTVTDATGCENTVSMNIISIGGNTGIQQVDDATFKVFPNPAQNQLRIEFDAVSMHDVQLTVYNIIGKNVLNTRLGVVSNWNGVVDVSDWPVGMYMIQLHSDDQTITQKLLIER